MSEEIKRERLFQCITFLISAATLVLAAGQVFHYPGEIRDIVTGAFAGDARLEYSWAYTLFAPFLQAADHFTILSLNQHLALLSSWNLLWLLFRWFVLRGNLPDRRGWILEAGKWAGVNLAFAILALAAILIPRPMARLQLSGPDSLAVDFHSHSSHSWDARKSFTPHENLLWHARAGFHAAFITDHNVVRGTEEGRALFLGKKSPLGIASLRGEEVSLHQSHWAVIGNKNLIVNSEYDKGILGVRAFLKNFGKSKEMVVVASLPEYWFHYWNGGDLTWKDLAAWGAHGFEIVNSAPQALDFPPDFRRQVIDFCREKNLVATGITDSHGWGRTAYVWNVLEIPGWRKIRSEDLEEAVIGVLKRERFNSARVLVRVKAEPGPGRVRAALDPLRQAWTAARAMPLSHATVSFLWLWIPWFARLFLRWKGPSEGGPGHRDTLEGGSCL